MESLCLRQGRLNELYMIPMEGNEDEEESKEDKENYIVELSPNEFPSFKKNCLVLSIILCAYLELGFILKEDKLKYKGFIMSRITSKTDKNRKKSM